MKLKKTIKFSLDNYRKTILIYYGILCACIIGFFIFLPAGNDHSTRIGGLETSTVVFLFIMGLCSFGSDLYLYLQNGISRKTACISYFITSVILSAFMAFVESICYTIIGRSSDFNTAFQQVYKGIGDRSFLYLVLTSFGWSFFLYLMSSIVGYCVAALYYRMNKGLKITVSIGVPVSIIFIIPAIDGYIVNGAIGKFFGKFALWIMGVNGTTYHPVNWMVFCLVTALIVEGIAYLLIKDAIIKSK